MGVQFFTLLSCPLDTKLAGVFIGFALHHLLGQWFGNVTMESLGHDRQLTQFSHGLNARNNGDGDTHLSGLLHKGEIFLVVEKQLGDGVLCSQILFLFQILHVHLKVGCFLMLLRIASYPVVKRTTRILDGSTICEETLVKPLHLLHEIRGVSMSTWGWHKSTILFRLIATQQQQIADAQELQVE